jgi:hypothetical protein
MGIFEKADRSIHSCTVRTRLPFRGNAAVVICRGDRCRLSLFKESLKPGSRTFETWFKAFRGRMQHRLDIAYDDYCTRRVGRSRVSRPVLLLAATSGFNEVIEFGSFVAVCQLVAGDEHQRDL